MYPMKIYLHHTGTPDGLFLSWKELYEYHTSYAYDGKTITKTEALKLIGQGIRVKRPLKDIGFHFGIGKIGDLNFSNIVMGRFPYEKGSHIKGPENYGSLGIVFIGNYDIDIVPRCDWLLGIKLVRYLQKRYNIKANNIFGHYEEEQNITCPGKLFNIDDFRSELL